MAKTPKKKVFDDAWGNKDLFAGKEAADKDAQLQPLRQTLEGDALVKETCRRLRAAKGLWDAHRNAACRQEREKALALYKQLTKAQKEQVPQHLRIWLRYRSEKYFGVHQTPPGNKKRSSKGQRSQSKQALQSGLKQDFKQKGKRRK